MPAATDIVRLDVNGDTHEVGVPAHFTLLETLRYVLGLTGSKQGCDKGDCGACTVIVDGQARLACITPVWEAEGARVVTVEGLARGTEPHPLQDEFDLNGAAQCGFCTPGILCSAAALLDANPTPTRQEIRDALSGNLCRCTGYTKIYVAVEKAAGRVAAGEWGWKREGLGPLPGARGALPGAEAMPTDSPAEDERPPVEHERVGEGAGRSLEAEGGRTEAEDRTTATEGRGTKAEGP